MQPNAVYVIVAPGNAFVIPPDPGPLAISSGTNSITSGNLNRDHSEAVREFKEWVNLERAGKKQIMEEVSKTFISGGFDRNWGFAHLGVKDIIAHLFIECRQVEYQDLVGNRSKLSEPWDANRPFQELVQRVQEIQEFMNDGGRKFSEEDIVDTVYTLVYNTGLFYDDCDKWDDMQCDEKTWANFQAHLQAEQQKFERKQKVSTSTRAYHG